MTSFLSVTPTSIRLGLFHSLLSFISISAPLILCAYVLWKYGRKYGLRAYLALTIGQMLFLLFIFYAPYALTHLWYVFEPYITMLGAILTYNFLYYMDKDQGFKNFAPFYYYYFIGIMFMNPIRIGNFNALSAIQILALNQVPTLAYCLIFSLSFFILNFSLGLILVYFLDNSVFLLLKEKKIKEIFYNAILISVVYVFIKFPTRIYYQALLVNLGFPAKAPELLKPEYPTYTIGSIPLPKIRRPILQKIYHFLASAYDNFLVYGVEFANQNVRTQHVEPNRNTYRAYEKFIKEKQEEREKDKEDEEIEDEKSEEGGGKIQTRKQAKALEGVWFERHAREFQMRMEMYEDAIMEHFWIAKRLQFRTPKYLKLTKLANSYDEAGDIAHETQDLKGNTMNEYWFRFEESTDPILWVRSLASKNRGIPQLKVFIDSILNKDTIMNLQMKKFISQLKTEYNRLEFEKNIFIEKYCELNAPVLYKYFKDDIKYLIEERILNGKRIKRDNLTSKELEALNFLSDIIFEKEILEPLLLLEDESFENIDESFENIDESFKNIDEIRKEIILDIEEVLSEKLTFINKENKVISYFEELHGDLMEILPVIKFDPSDLLEEGLKTIDTWTVEEAQSQIWNNYFKFLRKIPNQSFFKSVKNGLLTHSLYDAIEEKAPFEPIEVKSEEGKSEELKSEEEVKSDEKFEPIKVKSEEEVKSEEVKSEEVKSEEVKSEEEKSEEEKSEEEPLEEKSEVEAEQSKAEELETSKAKEVEAEQSKAEKVEAEPEETSEAEPDESEEDESEEDESDDEFEEEHEESKKESEEDESQKIKPEVEAEQVAEEVEAQGEETLEEEFPFEEKDDFEVEPKDEQFFREKIVPNNEQNIQVSTKGYKIKSKDI